MQIKINIPVTVTYWDKELSKQAELLNALLERELSKPEFRGKLEKIVQQAKDKVLEYIPTSTPTP